MTSAALSGKRVAILVAEGFEQIEMTQPRDALDAAGAKTTLVAPRGGTVKAARHGEPGDDFSVDVALAQTQPEDYDALLLPGGVRNPDLLRTIPEAVAFVRAFVDAKKPIAAICHGPWTLVEADAVRGKTLTSWPSLRTDIRNAGGRWEDREVVKDGLLVTSRKPDDIPAFNRATIELFSSSVYA
ncbi:MAG: type 1 glutamine amidotransferase domain-containing protein [Candidatus Tyrphobacter sp.]